MDTASGIVLGIGLLALGALLQWVHHEITRGSLPRNGLVGIRTRATGSSDPAWRAGHAAAAPLVRLAWLAAYPLGVLTLALHAVLARTSRGWVAAAVAGLGGHLLVVVILLLAARRADRAARICEDRA